MIVKRKAVIVTVLGASLAMGSAGRAAGSKEQAQSFESAREKISDVLGAISDGDLGKAAAGLGALWGDGSQKPRIRRVNLDQEWGGATGKPPELPKLEKPERKDPPPENKEPQPQRPPPPEIPKLPPSVIPGTTRPA